MHAADIEATLNVLDHERRKYTKSNKAEMDRLIQILIDAGEYPAPTPAMIKHGYTYFVMVEAWGAFWHRYEGVLICENCGADLRDLDKGPPFKREIALTRGDRCVAYRCPDCQHAWDRN